MIRLTNLTSKRHELLLRSYHELCEHINKIERLKSLETARPRWSFVRRKHETLSFVYCKFPKAFEEIFTPQEKEAFEKGLSLIEISKGDEKNVDQILLTPQLDTASLKRKWCHDYCVEHGYMISEWSAG